MRTNTKPIFNGASISTSLRHTQNSHPYALSRGYHAAVERTARALNETGARRPAFQSAEVAVLQRQSIPGELACIVRLPFKVNMPNERRTNHSVRRAVSNLVE